MSVFTTPWCRYMDTGFKEGIFCDKDQRSWFCVEGVEEAGFHRGSTLRLNVSSKEVDGWDSDEWLNGTYAPLDKAMRAMTKVGNVVWYRFEEQDGTDMR